MKKKIIIICSVIVAVLLIAIGIYFVIRTNNLNNYKNAETYKLNGEEITSVKAAIGERKLIKYSKKADTLELTFEDSDKEKSAEDYIQYLLDNGNYIRANIEDKNKKQISKSAENSNDIVIVETELQDNGFKVILQVGEGQIIVDPIEE